MDIELLGQSFRISTDEDNQYISQLVEHYQKLVHTVKHTTNTPNTHIVAILAGILAVDEYFKSMRAVNNGPAQSTAGDGGVASGADAAGIASDVADGAVRSTTHIESVNRTSFSAAEEAHEAETAHKTLHHGHEPPSRMTAEEALVEDEATYITNEILDKIGKILK